MKRIAFLALLFAASLVLLAPAHAVQAQTAETESLKAYDNVAVLMAGRPAAARAVDATGAVFVKVLIDRDGNVTEATAVSGHPLLRKEAAERAKSYRYPTKSLVFEKDETTARGVIVVNFPDGRTPSRPLSKSVSNR